ncbi:MAG TPA: cell division protein ZapE [Steroidobacteraceae bacterium]|nr:cell division protein ZapE [Steroidobacteraceae bacterium]
MDSAPRAGERTSLSERQAVTEYLNAEIAAQRLQFDPTQREAAVQLDALSEDLRAHPPTVLQRLRSRLPWLPGDSTKTPPRGLYLWGGVGRGKTLLMDLFFASLQPPHGQRDSRSGAPRTAERSHFYHFMRDIHAQLGTIKRHSQPLEIVARRLAARTRLICLDEFFVADIADAMILAGLFDGLFRHGVTLVTTSNLAPQELYKDGLQRQRFLPAIELIERHVDVIHLDGGIDYRLRQLQQAPTYLDSNRADTPAALQRTFTALAGGIAAGPSTLSIEGRSLHTVNSGPGMVWFEFSELCEGPRSQNDYIELARLYHTIVIANIPVFDLYDENAARRFIMAIDELYDRRVKIVVSAAAAPAALYHGERLQFEFERAASRLIEMQTRDYLAGEHRP